MSVIFKNLRWYIRPILFSIRSRYRNRKEDWIMGRVACMGQDVLKLLNIGVPILNIQKGRVDYMNRIIEHPKYRARTTQVVSFIPRDDIKGLILQQEIRYGNLKKPPIAFYMDSFSELTDQLFYHRKQNWYFCANYSDISHTPKFENMFETAGLLPIDTFLENYRYFFKLFRKRYESVPIIFMHFPIKLDKRKNFHLRYTKIKETIEQIETEFQPFYSITVDEKIVDWPEELIPGHENFPYHYNKATYQNLANQIKLTGVFDNFKNQL